MTSFVQPSFPEHHAGIERAEHAVENVTRAVRDFDGARGLATFLLAAVVSALLFAANQMMESWADGHLLAAWMALWTVAFAALALLASPIRRAVQWFKQDATRTLVQGFAAWKVRRAARIADEKMWAYARLDPRLMADIMCSLGDSEQAGAWRSR